MGDNSKRSINILNNLLPNRVNNNCNRNRIFLHYSDSEPTYFEHISFLIKDLEKNKFQVSVEKMNYTNHNSISDYFPNYLISSLDKIMEEK